MKRSIIATLLLITATAAYAQDIDSWTLAGLQACFGEAHLKSVDRKVKVVTFGPVKHFHNDLCFSLIQELIRGPGDITKPGVVDPDLDMNDAGRVWIDHKTNVTINQLQGFVFVAVKSKDAANPAISDGSIVATAHLIDDSDGEWFVVEVR